MIRTPWRHAAEIDPHLSDITAEGRGSSDPPRKSRRVRDRSLTRVPWQKRS